MSNSDLLIYVIIGTLAFKSTSLIFDLLVNFIIGILSFLCGTFIAVITLIFRMIKKALVILVSKFGNKNRA